MKQTSSLRDTNHQSLREKKQHLSSCICIDEIEFVVKTFP